jgi:hypothetical protein
VVIAPSNVSAQVGLKATTFSSVDQSGQSTVLPSQSASPARPTNPTIPMATMVALCQWKAAEASLQRAAPLSRNKWVPSASLTPETTSGPDFQKMGLKLLLLHSRQPGARSRSKTSKEPWEAYDAGCCKYGMRLMRECLQDLIGLVGSAWMRSEP